MRGVILAGGKGTRLDPLTKIVNKHLLPVYNRPMIEYPLKTLIDFGCNEIIIVSGGEHIGGFAEYLGDGSKYGVKLIYKVQKKAGGIAEALLQAEGLVNGLYPVILGDNYFEIPPKTTNKPSIYTCEVDFPERFGVYQDGKIIEKPKKPKSKSAVVGFYVYESEVFDYIRTLKPSDRGELEITDVNNWYLNKGAEVINYPRFWSDMGTFESLNEVANNVK